MGANLMDSSSKTFVIETYGCQMNVHDSERISGLLLEAGYSQAVEGSDPDLIVFNTCAVRENADNKLYGRLSFLAPRKRKEKNFQIAVGGCMAQKDKDLILERAPYVDVVFGTHNMGSLPVLLERARIEKEAQVEIKEALEHFPSTLPQKRASAFTAWVSISVGCNNTCTFCIVPSLRGRETAPSTDPGGTHDAHQASHVPPRLCSSTGTQSAIPRPRNAPSCAVTESVWPSPAPALWPRSPETRS